MDIKDSGGAASPSTPDAGGLKSIWRKQLIEKRQHLADRSLRIDLLQRVLRFWLIDRPDAVIGAYWPIKGEFDPLPALFRWQEAGLEEDAKSAQRHRRIGLPVVNKVDKMPDKTALLPFIAEVTRERVFASVQLVSALKSKGLDVLVRDLLVLMPESAPIYGEDEITDRSERFLAGELVREQLMLRLGEELPYSTTVEIERFEEDGEMLRIAAIVWVEREGQKPIVIGKGGERMKAISTGARIGMERLFGRKVFLETWCRVREGWSDDEAALRRFGYSD